MASRSRASTRTSTRGTRTSMHGGASKVARSRQGGQQRMHSQTGGVGQFSARGGGGHGHGGGYRGFKSKKQWRWAWATKQPWARKKSHETAGGPKIRYRRLPASKHSGHKGGGRERG